MATLTIRLCSTMSDYVVCDIYPVETSWQFSAIAMMLCGGNEFKLPTPYPDLDGRDFPWAPKVSYKELRSGRSYPQFFTGSYGTSGSWDGNEWVPKETRYHGTQHYTNGDKFTGSFRNRGGAPSEGTYTLANGNTLKGIFRDWQRGTRSIILKQPNSISAGTFYNKTNGIHYTGQWTTSTTGETTLSGYILVEDSQKYALPFIVYYRDGHPYEDFNKWFKNTGQCVCAIWRESSSSMSDCCAVCDDRTGAAMDLDGILMYDPKLHPDSREALWNTNFKKRIYDLWEIQAEADTAAGIGIA
jgi:hypothetical protein